MQKRRFSALVCLLVLLAALVLSPMVQADQSNTVYVRKHVSLLYDNSGSMSQAIINADNLKWCYASYAAQVFTGLLNDTDSLTVTFMNNQTVRQLELDLSADRQSQVKKVLDNTSYAKGGTPFSSVYTALEVLIADGLLSDAQLGSAEVDESEQFWLVLTTDGRFNDDFGFSYTQSAVEGFLKEILEDYSNLQVVYFGIGTAGDTSDQSAIDLRTSSKLTAYPNFSAYFAKDQDEIVSTMQEMSNRISGRYDVSEDVSVSGKTVTIRISGESSPIRNVAVLAQQTNARLVSAVAEDGTALTVSQATSIEYPYNQNYDNVDPSVLGGCTAMITSPTGKIPEGTVTLTFSENVNASSLSLMYEPAVYVKLSVQKQDASGNWVDVANGTKVAAGDTLRLQYEICEDGSDTALDTARLPGKSEAEFTCGDTVVTAGQAFTIPAGNTTITASVSLMDGAYKVSTSRTIQAVDISDYKVTAGSPLTILDADLEDNSTKSIDFSVKLAGAVATTEELSGFTVDTGGLQGQVTQPGTGVLRFVPKQSGCAPGEYTVTVYYGGTVMASQTVTVITTTYSAEASGNLTLVNDRLDGNTEAVSFKVTVHQGSDSHTLTNAESDTFRVDSALNGTTTFQNGTFTFIPNDPSSPVGDYTVTLYQGDTALAKATVTILPVTYSATASAGLEIIDAELDKNTQSVEFRVTAQRNGAEQAITEEESALFVVSASSGNGTKLEGTVAFRDGRFTFTPGGEAPVGEYTVTLTYENATLAQATVVIVPDPVTYTAEADRELTLFSNAMAGNTEGISFAVTAHRDSGDSPITAEEASQFRVEAVSADGTVLHGTVSFADGIFTFVPNDAQASVGTYTVTLYQADQALTGSSVTILLYNAQYVVEAHVSGGEVQRFRLPDNQSSVSFVIYADGVPCSADTLRSMLQEMIRLERDPGSPLMDLDITIGSYDGLPAITVTPTSWTSNGFLDFLSRPLAALGLVPAGDLALTLTVDALKGDSATGTLEIVYTMAELIFYLVLLAVILTVLLLVIMLIYSNLRMPRIRPGYLLYYRVRSNDGQYFISNRDKRQIKHKFYFRLLPIAESFEFHGLTFAAGSSGTGFNLLNLTIPNCTAKGTNLELSKYYDSAATIMAEELLTILRVTRAGFIQPQEIDDRLPVLSAVPEPFGNEASQRSSHTFLMSNGGYVVKKGEALEFWAYVINH